MEPHPVPQNILDVEFKLFGAFTLKQFGKILIGCLGGVGIFLININPVVKIPLILISVFTGILMAIIPNFGIWVNGFLKALFISPRYVWVKENKLPEILTSLEPADPTKDRNVSSSLNKKKLDINELPLEKLFGTRTQESVPVNQDEYKTRAGVNLTRAYSDVFGAQPVIRSSGPIAQAVPSSQPVKSSLKPSYNNIEDYQNEINKLKYQLSMLVKDQSFKDNETAIINRINELYREVKLISSDHADIRRNLQLEQMQNAGKTIEDSGKVLFGIVVDRNDIPVIGASVVVKNLADNRAINFITGPDGKFNSINPIPRGEYAVIVQAGDKKFHAYQVIVGNQPLPGYKLREK
jgi:hypothetical protein